jgi:hypothetical protein
MMQSGIVNPYYAPFTLADRVAGLHVVYAVIAALYSRTMTGVGQAVSISMFEALTQFTLGDHIGGLIFEPAIGEAGYSRVLSEYRCPYRTKDGYLCVLIYNDKHWRSFWRFRAAVTGQPFYSEMGKGCLQTLYFGKRPNLIRIYDKQAEYQDQYRTLVWKLGKDVEPPSFESVFGLSNRDSVLTRVERQMGGRIPPEVATLRQVIESGFAFKPFSRLKIIDHPPTPELDSHVSFETRCTGLYLQSIPQSDGMQAANSFISKYSNGNASWVREKDEFFLASASRTTGITEAELQRRFEESLARQMSA